MAVQYGFLLLITIHPVRLELIRIHRADIGKHLHVVFLGFGGDGYKTKGRIAAFVVEGCQCPGEIIFLTQ